MRTMTSTTVPEILSTGDQAAWTSAALVLALSDDGPSEPRLAATELLRTLGIEADRDLSDLDRRSIAAQCAASLIQSAAVVRGRPVHWIDRPDEALVSQGRASAQGAAAFRQFGLPRLAGLSQALSEPGVRMLDVGTGIAALAVAFAEQFPALTVVGIDVEPRVLALGADEVADSSVADRVVLREQDLSTLTDLADYALAWVPAPFIPESALRPGLARVARALIRGGWIAVGHGKFGEGPAADALTRFKTVAFGGTTLDDQQAESLLADVGLTDIATLPTPPGAPGVTVGRRP